MRALMLASSREQMEDPENPNICFFLQILMGHHHVSPEIFLIKL